MDGLKMLYTRRSVRNFTPDPVSDEIVEKIVKAGHLAATGRNVQPWEFVVVRTPERLKELGEITDYGKFIPEAPLCIAVFCKDTTYYLEDGSAAIQNILLAARYHGLGSCWVAGDKKKYADDIRRLCKADTDKKLIGLVSVGYPGSETVFNEREIRNPGFRSV